MLEEVTLVHKTFALSMNTVLCAIYDDSCASVLMIHEITMTLY